MKEVWVDADPWSKELVITALESGADAVIVPPDKVSRVRELGVIATVSREGGDLAWGRDVVRMDVASSDDEEAVVEASARSRVVVRPKDWKVIPLENLVARAGNLFVEVKDAGEAATAAGVLEHGVHGAVVIERDPVKAREVITMIKEIPEPVDLVVFTVEEVVSVGLGHRVCVDTCSLMGPGQGMLVGNGSAGMFLVAAETRENPYVSPRPFRVNAGAVHAYTMTPGGNTRYLSELESGDRVMCVTWDGSHRPRGGGVG